MKSGDLHAPFATSQSMARRAARSRLRLDSAGCNPVTPCSASIRHRGGSDKSITGHASRKRYERTGDACFVTAYRVSPVVSGTGPRTAGELSAPPSKCTVTALVAVVAKVAGGTIFRAGVWGWNPRHYVAARPIDGDGC